MFTRSRDPKIMKMSSSSKSDGDLDPESPTGSRGYDGIVQGAPTKKEHEAQLRLVFYSGQAAHDNSIAKARSAAWLAFDNIGDFNNNVHSQYVLLKLIFNLHHRLCRSLPASLFRIFGYKAQYSNSSTTDEHHQFVDKLLCQLIRKRSTG